MKRIFILVLVLSGFCTVAQDITKPIILVKGQKVTVNNTIISDADMGMGMQMKNNMVSTSTFNITGENEKEYILTSTLNKAKGSMEFMGNTNEFDSDNAEDKNSEMGKSFLETVGKPVSITLNKLTAIPVFEKKEKGTEKDEDNPMSGMMEAFGGSGEDPSVAGAFLQIPGTKKTGDSWTKSDSTKEKKSVTKFTINSISNNIATISFISSSDVNSQVEMQGNQIDVSFNTKSKGDIISDITTSLVSKRVTESEVTGTIQLMGQTMPVTAKSNIVSVYTLSGN
ncbi:MAG: DUF6263 family protein [Ferruginibacter sp.]